MAIVERRGKTASKYRTETDRVSVHRGLLPDCSAYDATLTFSMASKGGGATSVRVHIEVGDFERVADAMFRADPSAAIRAFGIAMAGGIPAED